MLAAWTAIWHPALIAAVGELPTWRRADDPPDTDVLDGELVVVPECSQSSLPADWFDRFGPSKPDCPRPICEFASREDIIAALVAEAIIPADYADEQSVAEFYALGYCYLQVELLTSAMHYSGIVNLNDLGTVVVAAATAAMSGDRPATRERLGQAFDLVTQARQHFYPVDFYLVDVTLLAESTAGRPLRDELSDGVPTNVLATARQIEQLAASEPESLAALRQAIDAGTAAVVGGPYSDRPLRYLPPELLLDEFALGQQTYRQLLDHDVTVFAQYGSDASPMFPQLLASLGYVGAMLTTFDGHAPPAGHQARTVWSGADGTSLEALWAPPVDTSRDEPFLELAERIGRSMQHEHVASVLLAGYSGARSPFYDDLRVAARFGPVLGRFVTLDEYFASSGPTDLWSTVTVAAPDRLGAVDNTITPAGEFCDGVATLHDRLLSGLADVVGGNATTDDRDSPRGCEHSLQLIAQQVGGIGQASTMDGTLLVNAWSFSRRPLPGLGYRWKAEPTPLVVGATGDENRLVNELVEIVVNAETGALQSFKSHGDRRTRVSQRLVWVDNASTQQRLANEHPAGSTRMEADDVRLVRSDGAADAIHSRGRLLDAQGTLLARFDQRVTLPRAERHVLIDGSLEITAPMTGESWQSYFASRLVWDERLDPTVDYGRNWISQSATRQRIVTREWIQVGRTAGGEGSLTLVAFGHAHHQRMGERALDTLLVAGDESTVRFRLAIGLDAPYPTQTMLGLLTPASHYVTKSHHGGGPMSGWFLHIGARNVLVAALAAINGPRQGVRMRLLETEGRAASVPISAFRPIADGRRTDFRGTVIEPLDTDDGRLIVDVKPYGWVQLEGYWA